MYNHLFSANIGEASDLDVLLDWYLLLLFFLLVLLVVFRMDLWWASVDRHADIANETFFFLTSFFFSGESSAFRLPLLAAYGCVYYIHRKR